ncbi:reverse transcriptase domain-containing protein, partial [Tanacetum coccineum]
GIDIAGPFPEGPGKVKFLIVAIDYFTKWIEAKPVATIMGNQVKKFVWDNIVCRFGLPGEIVSDNGKQFRDNPFKDWRTLTRPMGTPHHDKIKQWRDTVFTNIRHESSHTSRDRHANTPDCGSRLDEE